MSVRTLSFLFIKLTALQNKYESKEIVEVHVITVVQCFFFQFETNLYIYFSQIHYLNESEKRKLK